jgi:cyanophycinase-like exopeptidase
MKQGYLVLNGGDAFTPRNTDADRAWLRLIRGQRQHRPRLIALPIAATENHQKAAYEVVSYFRGMGTFPDYRLMTDRQTANTRAECEILDKVEAIVLTDGSAIDAVERLRDTLALDTLKRAVYERKAVVMATAASAMALGAVHWFDNAWEPAVGVAPHLAILAHHNVARMRFSPERLLADLPDGVTLIGIDPVTTLICHPDDTYQVEGEGTVTVYRRVETQDEYGAGKTFEVSPPEP